MYTIQQISAVVQATSTLHYNGSIEHLIIDSRKITFASTSLFIALKSNRRDGHSFIDEVYNRGVRNFLVEYLPQNNVYTDANFLVVSNTLQALQQLAAYHRSQFNFPIIGITGSNGKTVVKEWLYQLLQHQYNIVRSPRSYNSQIGVPLSIWQISSQNNLGIFEAGISTTHEMTNLQNIIQPNIGVLTNIGDAHSSGFTSKDEKLREKLLLFKTCNIVIGNYELLSSFLQLKQFTWSRSASDANIFIQQENIIDSSTHIQFTYQSQQHILVIPFANAASVENALNCLCVLLYLNIDIEVIQQSMLLLQPVEMRLQLKKAVNNCWVINDSYSNDVASLSIALDYLVQQSGQLQTTVVLSDIPTASSQDASILYQQVANELQQRNIQQFVGVGKMLVAHQYLFVNNVPSVSFFETTEQMIQQTGTSFFKDSCILLKGAREFAFERIDGMLQQKVHQTVMEVNLTAMLHNLKAYQSLLEPSTKVMAMVKAFSYGSGSAEVARLLQFHKVDYLAVAYADEGIELRKAGISLPIMVMNIDEAGFEAMIEFNLEPEIFSLELLYAFNNFLLRQGIEYFPIHIKLNTGMNRLGFDEVDLPLLLNILQQQKTMVVQSVFSHLTSSENAEHDGFTQQQIQLFNQLCIHIQEAIGYSFIKHIANSAAILRHPNARLDMVRLGIGLYGIESVENNRLVLQTVASLKTTIAQVRTVKAGDTVGYNKKGIVLTDSKIATIRIGYADGLSRQLSNGKGEVFVHGQRAKTIGNVCMDMTMIDVTHIQNIQPGDEVEIFGSHITVQEVAHWCNTISYEVLTSVNQRVKRIYLEE